MRAVCNGLFGWIGTPFGLPRAGSNSNSSIASDGIGALTMSALAERSGASKPVVYEHFENSEAVAVALLGEHFRSLIDRSIERIQTPDTIYEYFDIVIDCMFDYYLEEAPLVRIITNGFSSTSEVNAFYLEQQERTHEVYKDLLQQQGIGKDVAPVAAYGLSELIAYTVMQFAGANNAVDRATLKQMVRGLIHSLVPDQGAKPEVPRSLLDKMSHAASARMRPVRAERLKAIQKR